MIYMENTKEVWEDIPGYEGYYQVSNLGRVKSLNYNHTKKEKILSPIKRFGYCLVNLWQNREQHRFFVHRLVWEAFNGPIPYGFEVNHINEIKDDNRLENLNLLTHKDNLNWGTAVKRLADAHKKQVMQLSNNGQVLQLFSSIKEAALATGAPENGISSCCKGKIKTSGGYKWKYAI